MNNLLLAVDIGNTNIVFGIFDNTNLITHYRLQTDTKKTFDEYNHLINSITKSKLNQDASITNAIVSSVVPNLTAKISSVIKESFGIEVIELKPGIKTKLELKVPEPKSVGADRIANCVAAIDEYSFPCVVIDFGTATTFDYLNENGSFIGGIIAPGLESSLNALVQKTAKLPNINLTWPEKVIGNTTLSNMQSGSVLGYACLVDGLIEEIRKEQNADFKIIITGGTGKIFLNRLKNKVIYDPNLTLKGLRKIAELNMHE